MKTLSIVMAGLLMTAPAFAAGQSTGSSQQNDGKSRRGQLVYEVVSKWAPHVQEAYKIDVRQWTRQMQPLFNNASLDKLQSAANAKNFKSMNDALLGQPVTQSIAPLAIGSADKDLTYTPVTPCRILDTRVVGGQIAALSSRDFDVTVLGADYAFQGGSSTDCGTGNIGSFRAAVINFTVVGPVGNGFITVYPFGVSRPLAASLNYASGETQGNEILVTLDQTGAQHEMTIYTQRTTHVVADIVGYFINPEATALQCIKTAVTTVAMAIGANGFGTAPACAAGYTRTSTDCRLGHYGNELVGIENGNCFAKNNSGTASDLNVSSTCCRVPGR